MDGVQGNASAGGARTLLLGRCAGVLFLAGAVASLPANQLLSDPAPGWWMHLIDVLALVSGLICLRIPWDRIDPRWLHAIPPVATAEVVLTVMALGVHGEIYLWYFLLGTVFVGYAFRDRRAVAAHMAAMAVGFAVTALNARSWDPDAMVRLLVAIPTLAVAAAVVVWLREGLDREARTDALTGLGNRRVLMEVLEAATAPGAPLQTLVLFDLDGFKAYNDRFGHPAGDELLQRLGARLAAALDGGRAYRLGGDEFCVLLPGEGRAVLRRCLAALAEEGPGYTVTASHGEAQLPRQASSPSAALSLADSRMYAVKEQRRPDPLTVVASLRDRRQGSRTTPVREPATPAASPTPPASSRASPTSP